jgi:hypothetical protein
LEHEVERGFRHAFFQFPEKFISKSRGRTFSYLFPMLEYGLIGLVFNGESGSGGMADDPNHSDRILLKPFIRIADGSDDPSLKVSHSADIVYDGEICNIVEKAIDRDVSTKGIVCWCSKTLLSNELSFFCLDFFEFRSATKSGYLDDLSSFKKYMNQSEPSANDTTIFKKGIDLMGVSIGGDIEIFWDLSDEKIPKASSNEIR